MRTRWSTHTELSAQEAPIELCLDLLLAPPLGSRGCVLQEQRQAQFGEAAGLRERCISGYVTHLRHPSCSMLEKLKRPANFDKSLPWSPDLLISLSQQAWDPSVGADRWSC